MHSYELKVTHYRMKSPVFDDISNFKVSEAKKHKFIL